MATGDAPRPRPYPDRDSVDYWARVDEHQLELERCDDCGTCRWPPRAMCNRCGSFDSTWTPMSGRATVESWVVNHHVFTPGFTSPYTVVLGRLDEQDDLCIPAPWQGDVEPTPGQAIVVAFDDHVDEEGHFSLLGWRPG